MEDFTKEEVLVVEKYLFIRICQLEDAGLEDSHCYPKLVSFRRKLRTKYKEYFEDENN